MPKTKTAKKAPAPKRKAPRPRARGVPRAPAMPKMPGMNSMEVHNALCALTDPFCIHANGSRTPDANNIKSLPFTLRNRISLTANSDGNFAELFIPAFTYQIAAATVTAVTGATATYTVLTSALTTGLTPSGARVVSWGIRARNTTAPLTSSGMLRVRGFANGSGTNLASISTTGYNVDFAEDVPLQDCKEVTVIPRVLNDALARSYIPVATTNPTANVADWVSNGWAAVQISLLGGPASATVDFELIIHFELAFDDSDTGNLITKPSLPDNPALREAVSHFTAANKPVHNSRPDFDRVMKELASKAARKVGHEAIKRGMEALTV